MRLHILSDLHLEFGFFNPPSTDADVVVCAGDLNTGTRGLDWAREMLCEKPVVYIAGNHEYYGNTLGRLEERIAEGARYSNVSFLDNSSVEIGGTVFLGCTLWTDFALHGNARYAAVEAGERMTDYQRIRFSPEYRDLTPGDTARLHAESVKWLKKRLKEHARDRVVVVTHHAPCRRSLPDDQWNDLVSASYATNLDRLVGESGAALWIHGHVHRHVDYRLGDTRVICNPRGYPREQATGFDQRLVVDV